MEDTDFSGVNPGNTPIKSVEGIQIFVDSDTAKYYQMTLFIVQPEEIKGIHFTKSDWENEETRDFILYHEVGHIVLKHTEKATKFINTRRMKFINNQLFEGEADVYALQHTGKIKTFKQYMNLIKIIYLNSIIAIIRQAAYKTYYEKHPYSKQGINKYINAISDFIGNILYYIAILTTLKRYRYVKKYMKK
jgi:hypothetical protein